MKFWFSKKNEEVTPTVSASPAVSSTPRPAPSEVSGAIRPQSKIVFDKPKEHPEVSTAATESPANAVAPVTSERPSAVPLQASRPASNNNLVRPQSNQKVLYYQLMNGLYDAVLILDDNGHIVDCNERVGPVLGYTRDETWDLPVSEVIKGITPQIFAQMRKALHENHHVLLNARCHRKDGGVFQGEVGACLMNLTRGENLVFTVRNIEKRLAEALKAARAKTPSATSERKVVSVVRAVNGGRPVAVLRPAGVAAIHPIPQSGKNDTATASR